MVTPLTAPFLFRFFPVVDIDRHADATRLPRARMSSSSASRRTRQNTDVLGDDSSELASMVRGVANEMDHDIRQALKPTLKRSLGRVLSDDYDETDAKQLGKGAFSVVWMVKHRQTGVGYAAKVVTMKGMTTEQKKNTTRALLCEAGVSAVTKHPAIVQFHDLIFEEHRAVLVQEYCHGGTLLSIVQKQVDRKRHERRAAAKAAKSSAQTNGGGAVGKPGAEADARAIALSSSGGALREKDACVALRRVAEALQHLHQLGYVHRDVKLENLLLATPGDLSSLKLADFGFATAVSNPAGRRSAAFTAKDLTGDRLQGTVEYAAPEVLADLGSAVGNPGGVGDPDGRDRNGKSNRDRDGRLIGPRGAKTAASTQPPVDMWSSGVTTFLMLGGYHLFDASMDAYSARLRMHVTLQQEFAKPVWAGVSMEAKGVIRRMLCSDPGERVSAAELLADRWLAAGEEKGGIARTLVRSKTAPRPSAGLGTQGNGSGPASTSAAVNSPLLRRGHSKMWSSPGKDSAGGSGTRGLSMGGVSPRVQVPEPNGESPLRPVRAGYKGLGDEDGPGSQGSQRPKVVRGLSLGGGGAGTSGGGQLPLIRPASLTAEGPTSSTSGDRAGKVGGRSASANRAAGGPRMMRQPRDSELRESGGGWTTDTIGSRVHRLSASSTVSGGGVSVGMVSPNRPNRRASMNSTIGSRRGSTDM